MIARTSFLRLLRVDEAGLPGAEDLRHLGRLDVLVHVFRVVRREQLVSSLAGVLDELGQRLQPGQDDQVARVQLLPELVGGDMGRVDQD